MRLVDLSHPIEAGMITYPGLPGPVMSDHLSREASRKNYAPGTSFQIGKIELVANTGTYVDSPFHRFEGKADVGSLPLANLAEVPGLVVDASGRGRALEADLFKALPVRGRAVLVRTGWDVHFRTPRYFEGHPYLTRAAAQALVDGGAAVVGIDSLNIDDTKDLERPAHTVLLSAGIPIVEHLTNLGSLPAEGFRFTAVPAPVRGIGSFPVRAYATVFEEDR
jgi:kynurenine formamidase